MALQHLRSSTANKRPLPASMADGQLGINLASGSPGLFFKDSSGALVKVGPVHVGTTAPNATPATGGEAGNSIGEQWLDTTGGTYVFKVWDGSAWRSETGTFVDVNGDTMTGALGIIAGSASTPGLFFSGDTNTGIYSPGADQVAVSTGGTGRLFVDASGNIGINQSTITGVYGTTVSATGAGAATLRVAGTTTSAYLFTSDGLGYGGVVQQSTHPLILGTAGAERLRITSDGKVGIGTTTPAADLDVNGAGLVTNLLIRNNAGTPTLGTTPQLYSPASGTLAVSTSSSERLRIDSSGRVGIGTTSISALLDARGAVLIRPNSTTAATIPVTNGLNIITDVATNNNSVPAIGLMSDRADRYATVNSVRGAASGFIGLSFSTSNNEATPVERLFISPAGNVGIGTTPTARALEVSSSLQIVSAFKSTSTASRIAFVDSTSTDDGRSGIGSVGDGTAIYAGSSERLRIDSSGRLLVGTSATVGRGMSYPIQVNATTDAGLQIGRWSNNASQPFLILSKSRATTVGGTGIVSSGDVIGDVGFRADDGSGGNFIVAGNIRCEVDGTPGANDMPGRLVFSTTADGAATPTERLRIDSSGRVGIGTTSPATQLHIEGNPANITLRDTDAPSNGYFQIGARGGAGDLAILDVDPNNVVASSVFAINIDNTERLRVTSSGNVGIGTASPNALLEVSGTGATNNLYLTSTGNCVARLTASNTSACFIQMGDPDDTDVGRIIYDNPTNVLYFVVNAAERARIDSSGRLLVGTSSSISGLYGGSNLAQFNGSGGIGASSFANSSVGVRFDFLKSRNATVNQHTIVQSGDDLGGVYWGGSDGTAFVPAALIRADVDGTPGTNDMPGRLVFSTTADGASSPTERMRISNVGLVSLFTSTTNGLIARASTAASAASNLFAGAHSATDNTNGTISFIVRTNGDVQNTNNSYGALSDIKLKENIVDANSQWDDLKALQVRNYNFKEGQTHTQIGLIAQEVELVSPGLVSESPDRDAEGNDLGTTTKSVNYSVLYMKAVKALQEAMERIEVLEAKVNALEAN